MRALLLVAVLLGAAVGGPALAPYGARQRFGDHLFAPPMPVHFDAGRLCTHPLHLVDRLEQRYETDDACRAGLPWTTPPDVAPVLLLGADAFGRDVLSRTLHGARASLGSALVAAAIALAIGAVAGAWAGLAGGIVERAILKIGDILIVVPALYAVVALRAALPLVLPTWGVAVVLIVILVLLGWPRVARGVWAIVKAEADHDHVTAAVAAGASRWRVLWRHVLPACRGYLAVQAALLVPAFVLAEATMSYVGLGFPDDVPSWGTTLTEAANVAALTRAPWLLAPAAAIFAVALAVNILLERRVAATSPLGQTR
jgi:peptide/nickel transport system permease protein